MGKKPYTVVGYTIGEYQSFCHWTWSDDPEAAIRDTEEEILDPDSNYPDLIACAVLAGHHEDLQTYE